MIYFDHASTSHPKAPGVPRAVKEILESGCFNVNRGGYRGAYEVSSLVFDAREKIAALFDASEGCLMPGRKLPRSLMPPRVGGLCSPAALLNR